MNRTEQAYAAHLAKRKLAGEILGYEFEAVKLRLADNTHLTVDFMVYSASGEIEFHDTKGAKKIRRANGSAGFTPLVEDDAAVKMKVAAERFPFRFCHAFLTPAGWVVREV